MATASRRHDGSVPPGPAGRYLGHGERLVAEVRRHPVILVRPFATSLALVVAASFLGVVLTPGDGSHFIDTVLGLVAVGAVLRFGWRLWDWWADRLYLTDQRILEVSGIITRDVASMPLEKVTDMTYRRSLWGRALRYGEMRLESAGQDQALSRLTFVPNPDEFYRTVTSLVSPSLQPGRQSSGESFFHGSEDDDTGPLPRVVL